MPLGWHILTNTTTATVMINPKTIVLFRDSSGFFIRYLPLFRVNSASNGIVVKRRDDNTPDLWSKSASGL